VFEDQMVGSQVEGSCGFGVPLVKCHILNLLDGPSVEDLSCWKMDSRDAPLRF
jgi:hypothetical protein